MKKLFITLFFIFFVLVGFTQNEIDAKTVRTRAYFIFDNDSLRTAATADSIMGFVNGSDTATMIPVPSGGSGDTSYFNYASGYLSTKSAIDSVNILKLGINKANPAFDLDVNGTIFGSSTIEIEGTATLGPTYANGNITGENDLIIGTESTSQNTGVIISELPIKTRDSVLYISNDTVYRGVLSSGSSLWQDDGGGQISPVSATSIDTDTVTADKFYVESSKALYIDTYPIFGQPSGINRFGSTGDTYMQTSSSNDEIGMFAGGGQRFKLKYYTYAWFDVTGFGLRETSPNHTLDVNGDVGISNLPLLDSDSVLVASNDSIGYAIMSTGGGVTINNNTDNYLLTASGTANTINGESELQYGATAGQLQITRNGVANILLESYNSAPSPTMWMTGFNGSIGSVSTMTSGKLLGQYLFHGSSGSSTTETGADIKVTARGTWTTSSAPTRMAFRVTNTGSDSPSDYLTLGDNEVTLERNTQVEGNLDVDNVLNLDIGEIADGDATPDVSGANIMKYTSSETGSVTITDLDNPTTGAIYYIIGSDNTNTVDITDGGNFTLSGNVSLGDNDVLCLICIADNNYVEVSRSDN